MHPHGRFRLATPSNTAPVANYFFTDALGSVRAALDAGGVRVENHSFNPWGEKTPWLSATLTLPETKGWIGERYDEDAGLQYLNARYYDPKLGLFLQPDWFEVTKQGVGTNRYSYSFNDPVNRIDPNGNAAVFSDIDGDGLNEYVGDISPTDPAYYSDSNRDWIAAVEANGSFSEATGFSTRNEAVLGHALARSHGLGNVVGGSVSPSGIVSIYTRNSPLSLTELYPVAGGYILAGQRIVGAAAVGLGLAILPLTATAVGNGTLREHLTFYHYTTLQSANAIMQSGVIRGPAYVTMMQLSPSIVEQALMIANPIHSGRGAAVVTLSLSLEFAMTMVPDPSTTRLGGMISVQSIRDNRHGNIFVSAGPNPF